MDMNERSLRNTAASEATLCIAKDLMDLKKD